MIKKQISIVCISLISILSSFAQDNPKRFLAGGTVGFMYTKSDADDNLSGINDYNTLNLSGSLKTGYFITKRIVSGLMLEISSSNTDYKMSTIEKYNSMTYQVAPFFRYYIYSGLFGQGQYNVGQSITEVSYETSENKNNYLAIGYGIGLGYDIKLVENAYFEPMISFISNKLHDKEHDMDVKQNSFYINLGIIIKL